MSERSQPFKEVFFLPWLCCGAEDLGFEAMGLVVPGASELPGQTSIF